MQMMLCIYVLLSALIAAYGFGWTVRRTNNDAYSSSSSGSRLAVSNSALQIKQQKSSACSIFMPTSTRLQMCVDFEFIPINQKGVTGDSDNSWRTPPEAAKIVPIHKDKFAVRPEIITFDAYDTLIMPSQSIGKWYREALNTCCNMAIRLPRPALFTAAFNEAYAAMSKSHPCFGSLSGLTSKQWWYEVIKNTYANTKDLDSQLDAEELASVLPAVFEMLYVEVFSTKQGWTLKEDVTYTLTKLVEWRDQGAGPKIGVVSNFDDRLVAILRDLGVATLFDFIVTSYESKAEKPAKQIFELALKKGRGSNPAACYHIGNSLLTDVMGATAAGWTPLRYHEWFDEDFPDWEAADTIEEADKGAERRQAALQWGRKDTVTGLEWVEIWGLDDVLSLFGFPEDDGKPIRTTLLRGVYEDN